MNTGSEWLTYNFVLPVITSILAAVVLKIGASSSAAAKSKFSSILVRYRITRIARFEDLIRNESDNIYCLMQLGWALAYALIALFFAVAFTMVRLTGYEDGSSLPYLVIRLLVFFDIFMCFYNFMNIQAILVHKLGRLESVERAIRDGEVAGIDSNKLESLRSALVELRSR